MPINELTMPQLQAQHSPEPPAEGSGVIHELFNFGRVKDAPLAGPVREQDVAEEVPAGSRGPEVQRNRESHLVLPL